MSKNIKDLMDSVEKKEENPQSLEKLIEELQNENNSLKQKVEEQNNLINENLKTFIHDLKDIDEIKILKEMIISQRQEISQKEKEIKLLESNVVDLTEEIKKYVVIEQELEDTSLLENAHTTIENLLSEKSTFEKQITSLNNKLTNLEKQNDILLKNLEKAKSNQEKILEVEQELAQSNQKILELEQENTTLRERKASTKSDHEYITKLEDKILEYDETISNLEKENKAQIETIEQLKSYKTSYNTDLELKFENASKYITKLEEENRILREQHDEADKVKGKDLKLSELQKKITELEKTKQDLTEKNELLKAALLLHVDTETKDLSDMTNGLKSIGIPKPAEKHIKPSRFKMEDIPSEPLATEANSINTESNIVPTVLTPKEGEQNEKGEIKSTEGRRTCPSCGNSNPRAIREMEDKSKIISAYPRLYGKKYKCGQCGNIWS